MFENISIGVRTFLRDECLFNTLHAIRTNLPGAQIIVADCGDMTEQKDSYYAEIERDGHIHIDLPFDSGFGCMSNAIVDRLTRETLLIGSDDFDFSTQEACEGIVKLREVLNLYSDIGIASGRVNNNPYEFHLIEERPGEWREQPISAQEYRQTSYIPCDLTVNYSLMRKEIFKKVRWDSDIKIGGAEHGGQFLKLKRAGFKTVFVPGVNINEQKIRDSQRYKMYRRRALDPERPAFDRLGIRKYILSSGVIDYDKTN